MAVDFIAFTLFASTSQQYFSITPKQHQPPATSQPTVLFSHNKSAPDTASHQTSFKKISSLHMKD